jgi:hypothetical protein
MFVQEVIEMDMRALEVFHNEGHQKTVDMLTAYSVSAGDRLHQTWIDFFGYLFARFRDFIIMEKDETNKECGCKPSMFFSVSFFNFFNHFSCHFGNSILNVRHAFFALFFGLLMLCCTK